MVEQLPLIGLGRSSGPFGGNPKDHCTGCGADLAIVGLAAWNDAGRFCPDCEDNGTAYRMPGNRRLEQSLGLWKAANAVDPMPDTPGDFVTPSPTCACGCGRLLAQHVGRGRPSRFATAACRKRAQRRRSQP